MESNFPGATNPMDGKIIIRSNRDIGYNEIPLSPNAFLNQFLHL